MSAMRIAMFSGYGPPKKETTMSFGKGSVKGARWLRSKAAKAKCAGGKAKAAGYKTYASCAASVHSGTGPAVVKKLRAELAACRTHNEFISNTPGSGARGESQFDGYGRHHRRHSRRR